MPRRPDPPPKSLHLWVQPLARKRGIVAVSALSFQIGSPRQSLYPVWRNQARSISLDMYTRLCCSLRARPGAWFAWAGEPFASELRLAVQERLDERGWTTADLHFKAEIHMTSVTPILRGEQTSFFIDTLARIAYALDVKGHKFETGDLLRWEEPDLTPRPEPGGPPALADELPPLALQPA